MQGLNHTRPGFLGFAEKNPRGPYIVGQDLTKRARGSLSPPSRPLYGKAVARARRAFMQGQDMDYGTRLNLDN